MKTDIKVIADNKIRLTRWFDAPRQRVFDCWKSAEKHEKWFRCKEAVSCEIQVDFRVGGSFTQKMQIGNLGEHTLRGFYDEIVEPERIVYHANFGPVPARVTVEFTEEDGRTKVVVTYEGALNDMFRKTVPHGTTESLEFLAEFLEREQL